VTASFPNSPLEEVCNFQAAKELFEDFYGPFKQNHEDYK
jgi:hypothetical protein